MLTLSSQPAQPIHATPQSAARELRVMVVDDHPAVRTGVTQLLDEQPDLTVIGSLDSAPLGLAFAQRTPVDVAVVDYQLGGYSGLWLSRMLKDLEPAPQVVIYSAYCEGPLAAACVVAEADGLVSKNGAADELSDAVRRAADRTGALPPVPPRLAEAIRRRLTDQDQAIFGMLLAGFPRGEVARTLLMPASDLDARMWAILHKLEQVGSEPGARRRYGAPPLGRHGR